MTDKIITQEYLQTIFEYKDGELFWKFALSYRIKLGDKAGSLSSTGYKVTFINKKSYKNHRLIFLYHYGYLPKILDHIDGNPLNNKIENLREATHIQNCQNRSKQKNNSSGYKNIAWIKKEKKWKVKINSNNKSYYLGMFSDLELAILVATMAREKYHKEFAVNN